VILEASRRVASRRVASPGVRRTEYDARAVPVLTIASRLQSPTGANREMVEL